MRLLKLQKLLKDSEQRFLKFVNNLHNEESISFYKGCSIVIQFTNTTMLQIESSVVHSGAETLFQLKDIIVKNNIGKTFIYLCEKYFKHKYKNIKKETIIVLLSKIEISDFNIEIRYPTLDIERIQALKYYLQEQGIKQDLRKSSIRTLLCSSST